MDPLAQIDAADTGAVGDSSTTDGSSGYTLIVEDPQTLADSASLDLDTYALARMVASEEYRGNSVTLLALAECARNVARQRGQSVSQLLLHSKKSAADGKFSEQAAGKWASTREDPNGRHVAAAQAALTGGTNVALGAVDFFSPSLQNKGTQNGHALSLNSQQYIQRNAYNGLVWIGAVDGIDETKQMFFKHDDGSGTSVDDAVSAVNVGAAKKSGLGAVAVVLLFLAMKRMV